ncbi:MAG: polysaccharide biosynthesis protein [Nanoarchaeota archaeon]|nr:polysaccharide biosynthesis protein [Nanoarchaeota archaeon]
MNKVKQAKKVIYPEIDNKVILVTGGTGSFGEAVVEKLLGFSPKAIIIFSRDEKKQFDMRNRYHNDQRLKFVIGDVRDEKSVNKVMKGINLVFHAAALKQVPSCEFFPLEAVKTNILGSSNVIDAAIDNNVERVVILSTDKAVYPINVMGITKALLEKLIIPHLIENKTRTILCCVRYGNVIYSRGSVIPHFIDLIRKNKPLTVTNKDMTRFLLSLKEAIDLVLYALSNGQMGDIFVRKAPACTVGDLAEAIKRLFSYDKEIVEIGIRPGEKIHETLVSCEELFRAYDMGDYYRVPPESHGLDYEEYFSKGKRLKSIPQEGYTSENTQRLSIDETVDLLSLVDELKVAIHSVERERR